MLRAAIRLLKLPLIFTLFILWGHVLAVYYGTSGGEHATPVEAAKQVPEYGDLKAGQHFEYILELMNGKYAGMLTFDVVERSAEGFLVQSRMNVTSACLSTACTRSGGLELMDGRTVAIAEEFRLDRDGKPKLATYTSAFWNPPASCAVAVPVKEWAEDALPEGEVWLDPGLPIPLRYEGPICPHGIYIRMILKDYRYNPS